MPTWCRAPLHCQCPVPVPRHPDQYPQSSRVPGEEEGGEQAVSGASAALTRYCCPFRLASVVPAAGPFEPDKSTQLPTWRSLVSSKHAFDLQPCLPAASLGCRQAVQASPPGTARWHFTGPCCPARVQGGRPGPPTVSHPAPNLRTGRCRLPEKGGKAHWLGFPRILRRTARPAANNVKANISDCTRTHLHCTDSPYS